jgi:hypothetical protein
MQRWIPVALLLTLAACGGGGAAPTPVPVVAAPVLNGTTDIVFIGHVLRDRDRSLQVGRRSASRGHHRQQHWRRDGHSYGTRHYMGR